MEKSGKNDDQHAFRLFQRNGKGGHQRKMACEYEKGQEKKKEILSRRGGGKRVNGKRDEFSTQEDSKKECFFGEKGGEEEEFFNQTSAPKKFFPFGKRRRGKDRSSQRVNRSVQKWDQTEGFSRREVFYILKKGEGEKSRKDKVSPYKVIEVSKGKSQEGP